MVDKLLQWLNKPHPLISKTTPRLLFSFGIGLFVYIFLNIFNPFDFNSFTKEENLYFKILYTSISIIVILTNFFILPLIFSHFFNAKTWKIYKEIFVNLEVYFIIAVLIWMLSDYSSFYNKKSNFDFLFFLKSVFYVGIIPSGFYIIIELLLYKSKKTAIQENLPNKINNEIDLIKIIGENKKEAFELPLNDLIYINSEKNYSSIFYLQNGKIKEKLMRISLHKIENQLTDFNAVFRCHKSYIINTNKIEKIEGNAHGYKLRLKDLKNKKIPVSRKISKKTLQNLNK